MKAGDIRKEALKTFKKGQLVKLIAKGESYEEKKKVEKLVKVEDFYPYHVLTRCNGHYECFMYHDFLKMSQAAKNLTLKQNQAAG